MVLAAGALAGCGSDSNDDGAVAAENSGPDGLGGDSTAASADGNGLMLSGDDGSARSLSATTDRDTEEPSEPPSNDEVDTGITFNPFVMTAHDPQSTFAADVDTASYDVFRQYATTSQLPPPEYVRVEEWINYFKYAYPAPSITSELPFSISLAAGPSLTGNDTTMLRIGIQGQEAPEESKKPANIVYLIDTSGSMSGAEKLPLVQLTLTESLEVLDPDDTLSIVTYAGSTRVALQPTPISERDVIAEVINELNSGGSTAGAAGLDLAYEQAEAGFIDGGINHVVLCTDGDFNVGPSSNEELVSLIEAKRETGITLTVLGFGQGGNDQMMELVSNAGNGIYGVITDEDHAIDYVHERLLSSLVHIAKDVKLQVEFNPELVLAYRLVGYENRALADEDFRNDVVDAGEIGAGHRVTALYELVLADSEVPTPEGAPEPEDGEASDVTLEVSANDLVMVKIRYKQPGASAEDEASEVAKRLGPDAVVASSNDLDTDARWAAAVAAYAELVRGNPYVSMDELDTIAEIIADEIYEADADRSEFVMLFEKTRSLL